MIATIVAIGVVIAGLAITTTYIVLVALKKDENSEDLDFKCPECGASVDGTTEVCPECNAEFKIGEFECPVCGSAVSADAKICMMCNEIFEEEETFECPNCGSTVPPDTIVCEKCDEAFWSAIRPPEAEEAAEVEILTGMEEGQEEAGETASS